MKRQIIKIDDDKCNGCGQCIPGCPEGALQLIDGKARLISDLFCDGLGACIGECPIGAIDIEEREAEPYNEGRVMENIIKQGPATIEAHLMHLKDHGETTLLNEAIDILKKKNIQVPESIEKSSASENSLKCGCPGSMAREIKTEKTGKSENVNLSSELSQWPIQLHLINPAAQYFKDADIVIAADCVPFSFANFHQRFLKGKKLIILCPKLDKDIDVYIEKLTELFKNQNVKSITIVHMEVPCCFGVGKIVEEAMRRSGKSLILKDYTISISGEII